MRFFRFISVFALPFVLSACNDISSPKGILATGLEALQKSDISTLRGLLSGEALENYGNIQGMQLLRAKLEGRTISITAPVLINYTGETWNYDATYSVTAVDSSQNTILATEVVCHTENDAESPVEHQTEGAIESTTCNISKIGLAPLT